MNANRPIPMKFRDERVRVMLGVSALCGFALSAWAQDVFPLRPSEATQVPVADEDSVEETADPAVEGVSKLTEPPPQGPIREYVVAVGDNLSKIALRAYGRAGYWRLLKLYNECDPAKLKVGQVLKAPELDWWMEEEGMVPLFEDAVEAMMAGRARFMEMEEALETAGETLDESTREGLLQARELLQRAGEAFMREREGVKGEPNSTVQQLRTAGELIQELAGSAFKSQRKRAEVHERLGNALTYGIIWAREGFE